MKECNVALLVFDTLRFQGSPYNNTGDPFMFSGMEDFTKIENAITPAPWTLPAHVSLFSGLYLKNHAVHETGTLKESVDLFSAFSNYKGTTIQNELALKGYSTYGAVANPALMPGTGFNIGFDDYRFIDFLEPFGMDQIDLTRKIRDNLTEIEKKSFTGDSTDLKKLLDRLNSEGNYAAVQDIEAATEKVRKVALDLNYPSEMGGKELVKTVNSFNFRDPFFLFMNFMEAHDPYDIDGANAAFGDGRIMLSDLVSPGRITRTRLNAMLQKYSSSILRIREHITSLISALKAKGVYDNTLFIITSDHGQEFGEQNFYGHGTFLHDTITRIPMSVKLPENHNHALDQFKVKNEFVSLTSIREFINSVVDGNSPDTLFSDTAYSESYGIPNNYFEMFGSESKITAELKKYDHGRLAVYNRYGKITVNTSNGEIEEIDLSGNEGNKETAIENLIRDYVKFDENNPEPSRKSIASLLKH